MFSDIVGYDSLLKVDEKKAFDTRRKNQRIHRRLIKKFNGRWLKDMDSSTLASFSSVIDVVICALSIRKATEELGIPIRIGIHQGEVIFEKKDVLGDGVNIASRIQNVINNDGILISETVYKDIKNKEGLKIESLGVQNLKGVDSAIGIYKVDCQDESVLDFTIDTGELIKPLSFRKSTIVAGIMIIAIIAFALYYFLPKYTQSSSELGKSVLVLPFHNYLGTDTLDYFVAGMHNELISDIQKVSALNVKSKTTANALKNTNKSIPEIADQLGVNTFIEGAVTCIGDSVCLQVKLLDQEEKELWIQDFKAERSEILNLYNMVTKEISEEINAILTPEEEKSLAEYRTVNNEAYDAFLKANYYIDHLSPESIQIGLEYFQKAIEIDPDWAPPYAGMAYYWVAVRQGGFAPASVTIPKIYEYLDMAKKIDPDFVYTKLIDAAVSVWTDFDWQKGEEMFLNVLEINPNHAIAHSTYSHLLLILKRDDEAMKQAELALELDPLNPMILSFYAIVAISIGEYENGLEVAERALSIAPDHGVAYTAMAMANLYKRDYRSALNYMIKADYLDEKTRKIVMDIYDEKGYKMAAIELAEAIEKGLNGPCTLSNIYASVGEYTKAMDLLEQAYEDKDANLPYIGSRYNSEGPYKIDDPRFNELLKKMNLPLE
jgi:TolB-like protein